MYYVYLLETNHSIQKYYIGSTPDLKRRILEHQSGKSFYTKSRLPVRLIYFECYTGKELALEREKKLKNGGSSFVGLLKRLKLK
jgi:putative endonuclease